MIYIIIISIIVKLNKLYYHPSRNLIFITVNLYYNKIFINYIIILLYLYNR